MINVDVNDYTIAWSYPNKCWVVAYNNNAYLPLNQMF